MVIFNLEHLTAVGSAWSVGSFLLLSMLLYRSKFCILQIYKTDCIPCQ